MFSDPSRIMTDSSSNAGSVGETSNSSSISPTNCSRMSSTVISPAVDPNSSTTIAMCRLRSLNSSTSSARGLLWNHQRIMHDLTDLHLGNAGTRSLQGPSCEPQTQPAHQILEIKHADDVF